MMDRFAEVATAIAVLIETSAVLVFFSGIGAILLTSFGIIPTPY